ncbi:MAG: hypothetical protein JNM93_03050 [Bacteriovoracaceae bacterium]|nr:hypothetical protein [Bacteriovoracaceae bacterium]
MKKKFYLFILFSLIALIYPSYELFDRISRFYAREFCSCYFVLNRSAKYCENEQASKVPIMTYSIDEEFKMISATFIVTRTAIHTGGRFGCQNQYNH